MYEPRKVRNIKKKLYRSSYGIRRFCQFFSQCANAFDHMGYKRRKLLKGKWFSTFFTNIFGFLSNSVNVVWSLIHILSYWIAIYKWKPHVIKLYAFAEYFVHGKTFNVMFSFQIDFNKSKHHFQNRKQTNEINI